MLGRVLRSGAQRLAREPRPAYARYGGDALRRLRRTATDREHDAALRSMEHDRGEYSFERDIRPALAVALGGSLAGMTAMDAYTRRRDDPLRQEKDELREQRRLLDALNSALSVATTGNERLTEHLSDDAPGFARSGWNARFNNFHRQHARERRMREIIERLNTDYRGYHGSETPAQPDLVYDEEWYQE